MRSHSNYDGSCMYISKITKEQKCMNEEIAFTWLENTMVILIHAMTSSQKSLSIKTRPIILYCQNDQKDQYYIREINLELGRCLFQFDLGR